MYIYCTQIVGLSVSFELEATPQPKRIEFNSREQTRLRNIPTKAFFSPRNICLSVNGLLLVNVR